MNSFDSAFSGTSTGQPAIYSSRLMKPFARPPWTEDGIEYSKHYRYQVDPDIDYYYGEEIPDSFEIDNQYEDYYRGGGRGGKGGKGGRGGKGGKGGNILLEGAIEAIGIITDIIQNQNN
jgi:hypothetical protein